MKASLPLPLLLCCLAGLLGSCNDAGRESTSGNDAAASSAGSPAQPAPDESAATDELPPLNPCASPSTNSGIRLRGNLRLEEGALQFKPCHSQQELPLADNQDGLLATLLAELEDANGELYIQFDGSSDGQSFLLERLWRASPLSEYSLLCDEDLSGLRYLARGNEPFWGVEVRDSNVIALLRPADDGAGVSELLFDILAEAQDGPELTISGSNAKDGSTISVLLVPEPCRDSMAGDWFAMTAEVALGELLYTGCAWPGEAGGEAALP